MLSKMAPTATQGELVPSDPVQYAALEKRLVRRIDRSLMPVLIIMIVLN